MRRIAAFGAVLGAAAACLLGPAAADARPRALIGFMPTSPAPKMPLLFDLAERDFSYGVTSPTLGAFSKRQMLLDMSAGSRIANNAYPRVLKRLDLAVGAGGDGQIAGFARAAKRAHDAPGDVVAGLFGSTLERHGERIGYVGVSGFEQTEAVVGADRAGHVQRVSMGTVGTFARRAMQLWAATDVLVARFPNDASGLAALDGVLRDRRPNDLILIVRAPPAGRLRLLPRGMLAPGASRDVIYSPTTRPLVLGSLGLGAIVDRFVPWPLAPAVPAAIVFGAHAVDLAPGSPLIGASLAGPNPKGGARFFGIGNELEILLSLEVLFGLGAALSAVPARYVARGFAIGWLIAAVIIGSGRLGADVGGVITLGAGTAAAVLASLGRPPTRRTVAIAVIVPFAAVGALIGLDLLTSGGAHLTRSVVHGNGIVDLLDIVKRRLIISANGLARVPTAIICGVGVIVLYIGVRRRERIFAPLRDQPAFMAGIWGAFVATIVGALGNDSGPLTFEGGLWLLLFATGYARSAPGALRAAPERAAKAAQDSGVAAGMVG